jgi:ribonuclease HI
MYDVRLTCDGACSGNGKAESYGGWAAILQAVDGHELIVTGGDKQTTNNRMELIGCLRGLERIVKNDLLIEVVSDSEYLVNAFDKCWVEKWKQDGFDRVNGDLWKQLYAKVCLLKYFGCSFIWTHIPGHGKSNDTERSGVQDRCDKLAKAEVKKLKEGR